MFWYHACGHRTNRFQTQMDITQHIYPFHSQVSTAFVALLRMPSRQNLVHSTATSVVLRHEGQYRSFICVFQLDQRFFRTLSGVYYRDYLNRILIRHIWLKIFIVVHPPRLRTVIKDNFDRIQLFSYGIQLISTTWLMMKKNVLKAWNIFGE